jgi:hypothetical protein
VILYQQNKWCVCFVAATNANVTSPYCVIVSCVTVYNCDTSYYLLLSLSLFSLVLHLSLSLSEVLPLLFFTAVLLFDRIPDFDLWVSRFAEHGFRLILYEQNLFEQSQDLPKCLLYLVLIYLFLFDRVPNCRIPLV